MAELIQSDTSIQAIPENLIVMHGDKYAWSLHVWGEATGELWDHRKQDYIQKSELPEPLLRAHENLWEISGDDYLVEYQGNYYYKMDHIYNESTARSLGIDSWNDLYDIALQNATKAAKHDALKNAIILVAKKSVALGAMHVVSVLVNADESKEHVDKIRQVLSDCMFEIPEKDSIVSHDLPLQSAASRVVGSRSADMLGENQDLVVQFGVLWGIEMANRTGDKETYDNLHSFDSQELLQMFQQWGQEFLLSEFDDTVDFFERKFAEILMSSKERHALLLINDAIKLGILHEGSNGGVMVYKQFENGSEGWQEVDKNFAAKDFVKQDMVNMLSEKIDNLNNKQSLDGKLQSAANRAADSQPASHIRSKETVPEI